MKNYRKLCNKVIHKKYRKQIWKQKLNITFKEFIWDYLCEKTSFKNGEVIWLFLRIFMWMIPILDLLLNYYGYALYCFFLAIFNTCNSLYFFIKKKKLEVFDKNLDENLTAIVRGAETEILVSMIFDISDGTIKPSDLETIGFTSYDIEEFETELNELFDDSEMIEQIKQALED